MVRNPLDVAVAVMCDGTGRVLLARRPADKTLPGYLEFPGGKVERGETPAQALIRELDEELRVIAEVDDLEPLIRFEHAYPDFVVRLHAYSIARWQGEPTGAEGQALCWQERSSLPDLPLLPANRPLLKALALPDVLRLTPLLTEETVPGFARILELAVTSDEPGGVVIRAAHAKALSQLQAYLVPVLTAAAWPVLLNIGAVGELPKGFSGLHLPAHAMLELGCRPTVPGLIGASVHNPDEAHRARRLGLDYVIVGNVRSTPSHPDRPPLGWARFEEIALAAGLPAYAVGGVSPDDLALVRRHWGQGVAGIRAFWPEMA